MKAAFQKDAALLAEIATACASGTTRLWWLGQSGFLIARKRRVLVFDPYLSDSLTQKYAGTDKPHTRITERVITPAALGDLGCIDLITCSHNHTDHLDTETLLPLLTANPQAQLVIPAANREFVLNRLGGEFAPRLVEVDAGQFVRVSEIEIRGIAAAHNMVERDDSGRCLFLGYVARWDGLTIYHGGDTLWHDGLVPALVRGKIDIALLPINGDRPERRVAGNLDGRQAAQLAKAIGARCVIPCHFGLFEFNTSSPEEFVNECARLGQMNRVLRNGEGFDL